MAIFLVCKYEDSDKMSQDLETLHKALVGSPAYVSGEIALCESGNNEIALAIGNNNKDNLQILVNEADNESFRDNMIILTNPPDKDDQ